MIVRHLIAIVISAAACVGASHAQSATKPVIVTSIHPLTLMVSDLAGDWLDVRQLLRDNQEPHHVALTLSQRRLLDSAAVTVWVGSGLETFLAKPMASLPAHRQLSLAELGQRRGLLADPVSDLHLWLDTALVAEAYRAIAAVLKEKFPARQGEIDNRLEQQLTALDGTVAAIDQQFQQLAKKPVIVDHQAYGHFMSRFQIPLAGSLSDASGTAVGARTLMQLTQTANVACVVVEQLPPPQRAARLAAALKVPVVAIDPLGVELAPGAGYLALLKAMAEGFEHCLGSIDV